MAAAADATTPRDLIGRVAVVTGANTGIGFETARALALRGARVVLACRSAERAAPAVERIAAELARDREGGRGSAEFLALDLGSFASVRAFAEEFRRRFRALHILVRAIHVDLVVVSLTASEPASSSPSSSSSHVQVLNAGMNLLDGRVAKTVDGFELCFGTNYLAHFLLTTLLLDLLRASGTEAAPARVVTLSSVYHRKGETDWARAAFTTSGSSYATSKLAMTVFAFELQRRLRADGDGRHIRCVAVNPGAVHTEIYRTMPDWLLTALQPVFRTLFLTPAQGAATSVRACTDPDLEGGEYLSPYRVYDCCPGMDFLTDALGPSYGAVVAPPTPLSRDPVVGRTLWEVSERLTGQTLL